MKNKLRKMLSLVLAVVIAMSAISVNTLAATIMNIVNGSNQKLYVDWYDYSYNFNGRLKRFIDGLLSSALSLVYMGIIYLAGSYWCKVLTMNNIGVDSPMDVLVWLSSAGPKVLVVLAMGFLILKPPLALRQLTGGS